MTMGPCQGQGGIRDHPEPHCFPVPASPNGTWPALGAERVPKGWTKTQAAAGQCPWNQASQGAGHCSGDKGLWGEGAAAPQAMRQTRGTWMRSWIQTSPQSLSPPAPSPAFVTHWAGCDEDVSVSVSLSVSVCAQSPPPSPLPAASGETQPALSIMEAGARRRIQAAPSASPGPAGLALLLTWGCARGGQRGWG